MKKLLFLLITLLSIQLVSSQQLDQKTLTRLKVKLKRVQKAYDKSNYQDALDLVKEIEKITSKGSFPDVQNWKVKAMLGMGYYEDAKKELDILYGLNPSDEIIDEMADYESKFEVEDVFKEIIKLIETSCLIGVGTMEETSNMYVSNIDFTNFTFNHNYTTNKNRNVVIFVDFKNVSPIKTHLSNILCFNKKIKGTFHGRKFNFELGLVGLCEKENSVAWKFGGDCDDKNRKGKLRRLANYFYKLYKNQ
jgi:hypothetical protein